MPRTRPAYPEEFKREAVALVRRAEHGGERHQAAGQPGE